MSSLQYRLYTLNSVAWGCGVGREAVCYVKRTSGSAREESVGLLFGCCCYVVYTKFAYRLVYLTIHKIDSFST